MLHAKAVTAEGRKAEGPIAASATCAICAASKCRARCSHRYVVATGANNHILVPTRPFFAFASLSDDARSVAADEGGEPRARNDVLCDRSWSS